MTFNTYYKIPRKATDKKLVLLIILNEQPTKMELLHVLPQLLIKFEKAF